MSVDRVDDVAPSWHALGRWLERADPDLETLPTDAWAEAYQLGSVPTASDAEEIRYHAPTNTALLRRQAELVTVLSMDPGDVDSDQGEEILQAVEAQFGPVSIDNRDTEPQR